ncbi:MAG: translational GTPase TypA [Patescibacteria group bacterium]|jgi:GTP-binding protein
MDIKNIAIIAHVDHGKTTLVDALLKQTHTFRDNQKEMTDTLIMDSNDLEREKGITILAKNTSVFYKNTKINILDTPGHADFGGEVERVINMASAAVLLVDAAEGPLPQTKFVLKKALDTGLKIILVINKIDKRDARSAEVIKEVEDLFLELADDMSSLHFCILYAVGRDGKAFYELPEHYDSEAPGSLEPLFESILQETPTANINEDRPFQMVVSTLDYDNYVGKLCIGKVMRGKLNRNDTVSVVSEGKVLGNYKVQKLYTTEGLNRVEAETVTSGDIVSIAGIPELTIGQTLTDPSDPESLPAIKISEPTIKITLGPNTSPFSGKEGKFGTSRQIKERLLREKETNLGLKIEEDSQGVNFVVFGRGELHLSILIETMRREGFELEVSKPHVIYQTIDGVVSEPFEEVTVDVPQEYLGAVTEEFGKRKGELKDMTTLRGTTNRLIYRISDHNLIGTQTILMTKTRGTAIISSYFLGYAPKEAHTESLRSGALVASQAGTVMSYGIGNAQERGALFVSPKDEVYEGMVVGLGNRDKDIEVNVCRAKQLTNNRSSGEGVSVQVTPATVLSLEQSLDFINDDEVLEVTPTSVRIRKKILNTSLRHVASRNSSN